MKHNSGAYDHCDIADAIQDALLSAWRNGGSGHYTNRKAIINRLDDARAKESHYKDRLQDYSHVAKTSCKPEHDIIDGEDLKQFLLRQGMIPQDIEAIISPTSGNGSAWHRRRCYVDIAKGLCGM